MDADVGAAQGGRSVHRVPVPVAGGRRGPDDLAGVGAEGAGDTTEGA